MTGRSASKPASGVPSVVKMLFLIAGLSLAFAAVMNIPPLRNLFEANPTQFILGSGGAILAVWALSLFRRRNSTPEYYRDLGAFGVTIVIILFYVIKRQL